MFLQVIIQNEKLTVFSEEDKLGAVGENVGYLGRQMSSVQQ